ncbi:MAG: SH3 domain-containing protein [Chloroflexota bacterium]|nr:SH3 domain-containing protein [Chloroflexota bacterium]
MVTTDALNYRAAPGLGAAILTVLPAGTLGVVFNGPVPADGYAWYQVGVAGYGPGGETPGWVAGEFLTAA